MTTISSQGNLNYNGLPFQSVQYPAVQNIPWRQLGVAGDESYNRITKEKFDTSKSKFRLQEFSQTEALKEQLPEFLQAKLHSKAYKNAIEFLKAQDDYRAQQHYHDMLNKDNLNGKTNWDSTIQTQTDGSDTLYHKPASVRIMNPHQPTFQAGTRQVPVFNENGKTTTLHEPRVGVQTQTDMFGNFAHGVLQPLDPHVEVPSNARITHDVKNEVPDIYKIVHSPVNPDAFMSGSPQEQTVPDLANPSTPSYAALPLPKIEIQRPLRVPIPISGMVVQQNANSNLVEMQPATTAVSVTPIFKKTLGKHTRTISDIGTGRTKSQNVRDGLTYTKVNSLPSNTASVTAKTYSTRAHAILPTANARLVDSQHAIGNAYQQPQFTAHKIEPIFARTLGKRKQDVNDVGIGRTQSAYTGRKTTVSRINTNRPLDLPLENISSGSSGFPSKIKLSAVSPPSGGYNPFGFHTSPISS